MTADEMLHEAYRAPVIYRRTPEEIRCKICGRWLKTYYAEERLYSVWCRGCGYRALVRAGSPSEAAKVFGVEYGGETE